MRGAAFSRRPGHPSNRTRIATGVGLTPVPPVTTPITVLEAIRAGSVLQWQRPDLDQIVFNGGNVASLLDRSANLNHDTQGTAAAQPLWIASDAAANNRPGVQFDNVNDFLANAIARPAPATESTLIWCVLRQDVWTSGDSLFAGISALNGICVAQQLASPELRMLSGNTPAGVLGAAVGDVRRCAWYFSGSANDFSRVGSVTASADAGNNSGGTGHRKGVNRAGAIFSGWTLFDWTMAKGLTPAEAAAAVTGLDGYGTPWFGAGIIT